MNKREYIQFAAILRNDQCIVFGKDHAECFCKSPFGTCKNDANQGFLTNRMRFVGRKEAARIAHKAGQISEYKRDQILISEEIWWNPKSGYIYDPQKGYVKKA